MDGRAPEHRDSHASSSHEPSLEHRDEWYPANTVFTLLSRKTEIARSVRGPELQWLLADDVLRAEILVT